MNQFEAPILPISIALDFIISTTTILSTEENLVNRELLLPLADRQSCANSQFLTNPEKWGEGKGGGDKGWASESNYFRKGFVHS